jgi:hypothetical protein
MSDYTRQDVSREHEIAKKVKSMADAVESLHARFDSFCGRTDASSPSMQAFLERQRVRKENADKGRAEASSLEIRVKALAKKKKNDRYINDSIARAQEAVKKAKATFGLAGDDNAMSQSPIHDRYMVEGEKLLAEAKMAVEKAEASI